VKGLRHDGAKIFLSCAHISYSKIKTGRGQSNDAKNTAYTGMSLLAFQAAALAKVGK
jgi:hypothetical protein